jgi:hypothetical protein
MVCGRAGTHEAVVREVGRPSVLFLREDLAELRRLMRAAVNLPLNQLVVGSIPTRPTNSHSDFH